MSGDAMPKREGRGITLQGDDASLVQRDLDKIFRALSLFYKGHYDLTLNSLTLNGVTITGIVTTVGTPGSDSNVPTEQAVREAIAAIPGNIRDGSLLWAFFMGGAA